MGGDISAYSIGTNGALTQISCGTPGTAGCSGAAAPTNFATASVPNSISIDASGQNLYVAASSNVVAVHAIGADGTLTALGNATAGTTTLSVALDPLGRYAYAANASSADVSQFTVGANGALSAMPAASVAAGPAP